MTCIIPRRSSNFGQTRPPTMELSALKHLKDTPHTYDGENVVSTASWWFLIIMFLLILAGNENMH